MQNDMRDRLVELLQSVPAEHDGCRGVGRIADHLIANGVIVSPCKVGDTVYSFCEVFGAVLPYFVETLNIAYYDKNKIVCQYEANCTNVEENELLDSIDFEFDDIGKTVFLTREEAEAALRKRKSV